MGPDAMILVFWILSFKPTFSLSSFTFLKRLFSSSSFSPIRMVSSAYLRVLVFLPAILIPACASSSPAFLMMYSVYKINKQSDNIQPWRTPFPIWNNQSVVPFSPKIFLSFLFFNVIYLFKIFIFTLFYFTILYWFCHTLTWIHHGCTCDPKH